MSVGASKWVSPVVSWFVVTIIAVATTTGLIKRFLTPDDAPYLLVTREVSHHPVLALLLFVVTFALYAAGFRRLCRLVAAWREGTDSPEPVSDRAVWCASLVDYLFARWYRVAIALAIVWLPFYLTSFPGQPSPDAANMLTEFLMRRTDFPPVPPGITAEHTAPFEGYPTSSYLLTDSNSLWSNHHPLFLMLIYGSICWVSGAVFDSLVPGLMVISALSAFVTVVAFGRAMTILGGFVTSWRHRFAALTIVAATPLIAMWSLAPHKNQLFSAAFVWWLALMAQLLHSREPVGRRWYVETALVSLLIAISVQFGWILCVAQAVALLFVKRGRLAGVVAIGMPALLVWGSISMITASGAVIPSDPVETRGVQLQVLGLMVREHPDVLTTEERAELSRIFDLESMAQTYDPLNSDSMKSTGPLDLKTGTFKYRTVQESDWDSFNEIVLRVAARHPDTALDALFLKSYAYLDPLDEGTDWYPPWSPDYVRVVAGHQIAPMNVNHGPRTLVRDLANDCQGFLPCRPFVSPTTKTVAVALILLAGIAVRRRFAWLWALPFALQLAIAAVSPLSAGGRYVLGFTYALGIVVLLMAVDDRAGPPTRTPTGSQESWRPFPLPSRRPWHRAVPLRW